MEWIYAPVCKTVHTGSNPSLPPKNLLRLDGEIGRHAGLKIPFPLLGCGFDSHPGTTKQSKLPPAIKGRFRVGQSVWLGWGAAARSG